VNGASVGKVAVSVGVGEAVAVGDATAMSDGEAAGVCEPPLRNAKIATNRTTSPAARTKTSPGNVERAGVGAGD
jgi:hypothetical protein